MHTVGYHLVEDKTECSGTEKSMTLTFDVGHCAKMCQGISTMFVFGTNDYGNDRCYDGGCKCLCETAAKSDGTCNKVSHNGYRLYRVYEIQNYKGKWNISCFMLLLIKVRIILYMNLKKFFSL